MAESIVYIKNCGVPLRGARVTLAFEEGGMTGTLITDRSGRAKIHHIPSGNAEVMVNGNTITTFNAPDTVSVEL